VAKIVPAAVIIGCIWVCQTVTANLRAWAKNEGLVNAISGLLCIHIGTSGPKASCEGPEVKVYAPSPTPPPTFLTCWDCCAVLALLHSGHILTRDSSTGLPTRLEAHRHTRGNYTRKEKPSTCTVRVVLPSRSKFGKRIDSPPGPLHSWPLNSFVAAVAYTTDGTINKPKNDLGV